MQLLNKNAGKSKIQKNKIKFIKIRTLIVLICVSVIFACTTVSVAVFVDNEPKSAAYTVVIDAGHGGVDGGVVGISTGVLESDLNLKVAGAISDYFDRAGVNVVLTRKNKNGLYQNAVGDFKSEDFRKRKKIIEGAAPDIVVSVHMNYFGAAKYRRGVQVFYNPVNNDSREVAALIQGNLNDNVNKKYTGRDYSSLPGDYYIVNCTPYPSVIVECGFLSNADDEKLLINEDYQRELAYCIFSACMNYLFTCC